MVKSLLALTVLFTVGITVCFGTEHVHVPTDTEFEGNHYGSCVCQQKCSDLDPANSNVTQLLSALSSLERKVTALQATVDRSNRQGAPQTSCPDDFVYSGWLKVCYKLFTDKRTWSEAKDFCRDLQPSAVLAASTTDGRLNFVRYLATSEGLHTRSGRSWAVWLGGRQEGDEGDFLWSDGQTVAGNWGPGQPNNSGDNSDCLALLYHGSWGTSHLNDIDCFRQNAFVCEYVMK